MEVLNMNEMAHVGIIAKDADRSVDFYCRIFGCQVVDSFQDEKLKAVFLTTSNGTLEILQYFGQEYGNRCLGVVDHVAFMVDDMDSAINILKQNNVKMIFDEPRTALNGTKKIMFFLGPDNERLEFVQEIDKF
jgi:lactoylglutathione lyase